MSQIVQSFKALPTPYLTDSGANPRAPLVEVTRAVCRNTSDWLGMPFDVARAQYADAAKLGLIERSILGSANFGRLLTSLEQMTLGPWARHR